MNLTCRGEPYSSVSSPACTLFVAVTVGIVLATYDQPHVVRIDSEFGEIDGETADEGGRVALGVGNIPEWELSDGDGRTDDADEKSKLSERDAELGAQKFERRWKKQHVRVVDDV